MNFDIRNPEHLRKLNSLTKYPSIETYHALENGRLVERVNGAPPDGAMVYGTEKVDGTNARIVVFHGCEFIIGSREQLLHYSGDVLFDPAQGIVEALREKAQSLARGLVPGTFAVFYGEVYGGNINAAKNYTATKATGFRVFDAIADLPAPSEWLGWSLEQISAWRESGGQKFLGVTELRAACDALYLAAVPQICTMGMEHLSQTLEGMCDFLAAHASETRCGLDAKGAAEGIVFRTADRKWIRKARFEDYRRALGRRHA